MLGDGGQGPWWPKARDQSSSEEEDTLREGGRGYGVTAWPGQGGMLHKDGECQPGMCHVCMYPCMCVHVCTCVHMHMQGSIYSWALLGTSNIPTGTCTSGAQTLDSKYHLPLKWVKTPWKKWLIPQLGPGNQKVSLEHLVVLESEGVAQRMRGPYGKKNTESKSSQWSNWGQCEL